MRAVALARTRGSGTPPAVRRRCASESMVVGAQTSRSATLSAACRTWCHVAPFLRAGNIFKLAAHSSGYSLHVHGARSLTLRTRHPSPDHSLYPYPHTDHLCPIFHPSRCPFALRIYQPLASPLELAGAGCRACRAAKPRVERWRARAAPAMIDSPPERRVWRPPRACSGERCVSVY